MFTPRVEVIKMPEMDYFMYLLLDTAKYQFQSWARYLIASVRSYLDPSENTMDYIQWSYHWQNFNV